MAEEKQVNLDELMEELAPEKIQKKVVEPHAKAHEKYKLEKISVDSFEDFKKQVISYMKHHHKEMYKTDLPDDVAYSRGEAYLDAAFEEQGGFKAAYKLAKQGRLRDVIESLSKSLRQERTAHYTKHIMRKVDPFDFEKHVDLAKQYIGEYGKLLKKSGIEIKKPEEMAKDYQGLINTHVNLIDQLTDQMGKYKSKKDYKK